MTNKISFFLASNHTNLAAAIEGKASATVEAEYGDVTVAGSVLTMAHHGVNAGNRAPCAYPNGCAEGVEVVGLSHFDLDTLGGCAAVIGRKPEAESFWILSEFVDLNGPHKLGVSGASDEDIRRLNAFWAWSEKNRVFANRDGSVSDVTDKVIEGIEALEKILADDEQMLVAGDEFKAKGDKLNAESFVEYYEDLIIRVSPSFVNHLYVAPDGKVAKAVIGFNTLNGSITVSFADAPKGTNARDIVQKLWGPEAGGHAGIAGSPRDKRLNLDDLSDALRETMLVLDEMDLVS
ncbi:MAG: hypothetical protein KC582_00170 [Candidatus Magasanikbacteria bacterium]|nr:hypothetical protein [Candidatus Magasanikbacteria bacterium]